MALPFVLPVSKSRLTLTRLVCCAPRLRIGFRIQERRHRLPFAFASLLFCAFISVACGQQPESTSRWTDFVQVAGQPEPVPAEWVATPEGEFAHSIRIPHPVSKDSGYRDGITSREYFDHLCRVEAGEFIYKTVANVEGFFFMRPPSRPTDDHLKDRYKLEAPEIERLFQLMRDNPTARARLFVNPPWNQYRFIEEPSRSNVATSKYVRSSGYRQDKSPMTNATVPRLDSKFAVVWRGVRRPQDRELSIAGGEWIVFELESKEVLAVMRMFGLSPRATSTPDGIWWLNASQCPGAKPGRSAASNSSQLYDFLARVLRPRMESDR